MVTAVKLGRNSGTLTTTGVSAVQILGPNPKRYSLTVSIASVNPSWISVDFAENTSAGRGVNITDRGGPFVFHHDDFG